MTNFTTSQLQAMLSDATPGPWRVEDETTLVWGHCNDDDNSTRGMGYPIAQAQLRNYGWNADAINWERVTANAALIAAAPDLARLVLEKDAEIARLKAALKPFVDATINADLKRLEHNDLFIRLTWPSSKGHTYFADMVPQRFIDARQAMKETSDE